MVAVVVTRNAPRFWLATRFLRNLVTPVPAPLARGVGTVFELLDSLPQVLIRAFERVELDNGGSTVLHDIFTYLLVVT